MAERRPKVRDITRELIRAIEKSGQLEQPKKKKRARPRAKRGAK